MSDSIVFHGREYRQLFPGLMRDLTPEEDADLGAAIARAKMVGKPIATDGNGGIGDGWNRLRWAAKLQFEPPQVTFVPTFKGLDCDEQKRLAEEFNDTGRQDSMEVRMRARDGRNVRVVDARRSGESLRTIAENEGISVGQVQRDLTAASTVSGDTVEPTGGKVTGKDGRTRTAKPKKPPPPPKPCKDCLRKGVPACDKCRAAFPKGFPKPEEPKGETWSDRMKRVNSELEAWCKKLTDLTAELPAEPWLNMYCRGTVLQKIKDAAGLVRSVKCTHQCPECKGQGCDKCHKTGRMPKAIYDQCA